MVEGDGLAQAWVDTAECGEHGRYGLGGCLSHQPRGERDVALVQDEHGPRALADDEIALPMSDVGAGVDVLWPVMDRAAVFDQIAARSGPARPSALVTAGQIAPEVLAFAGDAIDKGVDGLAP